MDNTDWIDLAQDTARWWAVVNALMNFRVPQNLANLTSWRPVSFSGRTRLYGGSVSIKTCCDRVCTYAVPPQRRVRQDISQVGPLGDGWEIEWIWKSMGTTTVSVTLMGSLLHWFVPSLTHSFSHAVTHPFTRYLIHSLLHSPILKIHSLWFFQPATPTTTQ
jgi:hypothetical protein